MEDSKDTHSDESRSGLGRNEHQDPKKEESAEPSPGLKDVEEAEFNYLIPALPVEIIEQILKYTFLRPSKLTPSSDPHHLVGTSPLLLISKGFRELCLPIFFQSITISRPSHWITFFDPEHGLFAGEDGRKLWSFVKEVAIVLGVQPPIPHPPQGPHVYVCPLEVPSRQTPLDAVCFLGEEDDHSTKEEDGRRVVEVCRLSLGEVEGEIPEDLAKLAYMDYEDPMDIAFNESRAQRRTVLVEKLFGNGRPRECRIALDAMLEFQGEGGRLLDAHHDALRVFPPSSTRLDACGAAFFVGLVIGVREWFGPTSRVHLKGQPSFLQELPEWLEKNRKWFDLLDVIWSWDLENGSRFVYPASVDSQAEGTH